MPLYSYRCAEARKMLARRYKKIPAFEENFTLGRDMARRAPTTGKCSRSYNQHRISVAVEAIPLGNSFSVRLKNQFTACKGGHEEQEG